MSALGDFFSIFFVYKGSPFKFFDILQQIEVSKSPNGLPFQVFRHYETGSKFLFFDFPFFSEKPKGFTPFTISKSLSILSLRNSADFRRSRLVFVFSDILILFLSLISTVAYVGHDEQATMTWVRRVLYTKLQLVKLKMG